MPVDMTMFEPDGLQVHIQLNSLLHKYGFFDRLTGLQKKEFDAEVEKILRSYLPYDDEEPFPTPGTVLLEEFIVPGAITFNSLAEKTGKSMDAIMEVVSGRPLSDEMAELFGKALGTTTEFWKNLQSAYAEELVKRKDKKKS